MGLGRGVVQGMRRVWDAFKHPFTGSELADSNQVFFLTKVFS